MTSAWVLCDAGGINTAWISYVTPFPGLRVPAEQAENRTKKTAQTDCYGLSGVLQTGANLYAFCLFTAAAILWMI